MGEIEDYYNNNLNVSSIVNWDIFRDVDHLIGKPFFFDLLNPTFDPKLVLSVDFLKSKNLSNKAGFK